MVRHGESMGNIDETIYATMPDSDVPLSELGRKQALEAGHRLRALIGPNETVRVYCSPYKRCVQTLDGLLCGFNHDESLITIRSEPRLRELDFGNFESPAQMRLMKEERKRFGAFYYRFPSGESGADVFDRASSLWESLFREWRREGVPRNYVLVTHGLTARFMLTRYFRWSVEQFNTLMNPDNLEFKVMELQPDDSYKLVTPMRQWGGGELTGGWAPSSRLPSHYERFAAGRTCRVLHSEELQLSSVGEH
eukprot:CAMPEP_0196771550 /NCGR_PEP_ID=MMETSP1104-20130614/1746_1 /TAXON_ID=33652 /ORGANISM="Cafeteria sp., Strain Caron Lab Isolate" /LENGTH=250 /DNA_ID=CAMNT_0042141671 /DNA_START=197 /DNA_END=949 /DNA_ORIENTATION=+